MADHFVPCIDCGASVLVTGEALELIPRLNRLLKAQHRAPLGDCELARCRLHYLEHRQASTARAVEEFAGVRAAMLEVLRRARRGTTPTPAEQKWACECGWSDLIRACLEACNQNRSSLS